LIVPNYPYRLRFNPIALGLFATLMAGAASAAQPVPADNDTGIRPYVTTRSVPGGVVAPHRMNTVYTNAATPTTPIQHVILILGENRTFDHLFATYTPPAGQTVNNLLSEGIVTATGAPGPNVALAKQWQASDTTTYSNAPTHTTAYTTLPAINTGSAPTAPYFASAAAAEAVEPGLPTADYAQLAEGGTGLKKDVLDTRFPATLPNQPVNTHAYISYDDYTNSPVHRFFQMWQELDCSITVATTKNPSGCRMDLFPWVETTIGTGSNGKAQSSSFSNEWTYEGATSMMFLNMAQGDAPYFKQLATTYSLADNMHQAFMGGTGNNHIMIGYGAPIYYENATGGHATPPSNQIENPNPESGTNNWYTNDGYAGGSYVDCASTSSGGVAAINTYLASLPYATWQGRNCASGFYYLVNNFNPGYLGDGTAAPLGSTQYTIPPVTENNIGLLMSANNVTWKYYGEGWDNGAEDGEGGTFCNICDPFLYSKQIMTSATLRANNEDLNNLYTDITNNTLPQVSIVKPDENVDGHPASSKFELFEDFTQKIVQMVQANPTVWANTAIIITTDEGGGHYDSGYVQPIDFFGDGTRIPLLVVSPWSTGGKVVHTYYDHVSFDKFIEANWGIKTTISTRSRDNLPNPIQTVGNPYVPTNSPAIGNLMDMFTFPQTTKVKD
jgi:phospholipase C